MSRKIIFFINPISGIRSKINLEETIIRKCEEKNRIVEILFTSADNNYDFLAEKIVNENITDIGICGGDGSIAPIVSSILNRHVNVGIVPMGSGNGLARTAGIPKLADKAIDVILNGNPVSTDVFLINNKLSTHVCGLGFDAKVAHEFSKQKKRGLNSYTKIALKNFLDANAYPFVIEVENISFKTEAFIICIANSNQFGNNFKIAPLASICDGLLDIVILKKSTKPQIVFSFIRQILSGKIKNISEDGFNKKNITYFQTKNLKISNPSLAPLHIDGDPAETTKDFTIEILPAAYKLIHPK